MGGKFIQARWQCTTNQHVHVYEWYYECNANYCDLKHLVITELVKHPTYMICEYNASYCDQETPFNYRTSKIAVYMYIYARYARTIWGKSAL